MKTIVALLILLLLAGGASATWYDTDYSYMKQITIQREYVNGTVANHSLLVDITDTDLRDKAQADADDIIFVNAANDTQLDHQIELYTSATGALVAWVRIPSITNSVDTKINMYYGYSAATNSENPSGVWGSSAEGIWLMNEGTGVWAEDSSGNSNNGSLENMASPPTSVSGWNVSGKADGAMNYDGSDDNVNVLDSILPAAFPGSDAGGAGYDISVETWVQKGSNDRQSVSKYDAVADCRCWTVKIFPGVAAAFVLGYSSGNSFTAWTADTVLVSGTWYYVVATFNDTSNKVNIYVNGDTDRAEATFTESPHGGPENLTIGKYRTYHSTGLLDTIKIHNRELTAVEIATTYNNTNSPATFSTVGAERSQDNSNSIDMVVLYENSTNLTCLIRWNITRIGASVTHWNVSYSNTLDDYTYYFKFDNLTTILSYTATANDQTLWFNSSTLLPVGIYRITATALIPNVITLYANEYALINNWTADQTYQQIAANISNDLCYSYYNPSSGLWEAYRAGYTYNANNVIPKNSSVFVFVNAQTTISTLPQSGGITITQDTWFYGMLPGSAAKTLTEITTKMDSDGRDVWAIYGWNNVTQAYTATGSYSVAPNEGYCVYCNVTGEYTP